MSAIFFLVLTILPFAMAEYIGDLYPYSSVYKWFDESGKAYDNLGWCKDSNYIQLSGHSAIKTYPWESQRMIELKFSTFFIDIDSPVTENSYIEVYINDVLINKVNVPKTYEQNNLCGGTGNDLNISQSVKFDLNKIRNKNSDNDKYDEWNAFTVKFVPKNTGKTILGISNIQFIENGYKYLPAWASALLNLIFVSMTCACSFYCIRAWIRRCRKARQLAKINSIAPPNIMELKFSDPAADSLPNNIENFAKIPIQVDLNPIPMIETVPIEILPYAPRIEIQIQDIERGVAFPELDSPSPSLQQFEAFIEKK
jgi:hypothetical protein